MLHRTVVKAANQLLEAGKTPTVELIRETLGGTGSHSTIGPYLKRWKDENRPALVEAQAGLPAPLIQTVRTLYEHLQATAQLQVDELSAQHDAASEAAAARLHALQGELEAESAQRQLLAAQVRTLTASNEEFQDRLRSQALAQAILDAEKAALQQRLDDKAVELAQERERQRHLLAQVEHTQRDAERRRVEAQSRIDALTAEVNKSTARNAELQAAVQHQALRLESLKDELVTSQKALAASQEHHAAVRSERDRLQARLDLLGEDNERQSAAFASVQAELQAVRQTLASREGQELMLREQLRQANDRIAEFERRQLDWQQERGSLLAKAEHQPIAPRNEDTPRKTVREK